MRTTHFHRTSLVEQAASVLRESIERGDFVATLPGENQLSSSLNISRPTLRQALSILEKEGYLEISKGKKTRICKRAKRTPRKHTKSVCIVGPVSWHALQSGANMLIHQFRAKLAEEGIFWEEFLDPKFKVAPDACRELIRLRPNACWILVSTTHEMQRVFQEACPNAMVLGTCYPQIELPSIDWNFSAIGFHAGGLFLRYNHHRIALVRPQIGESKAGDLATKEGLQSSFKNNSSQALQLTDFQSLPSLSEFRIAFERMMSRTNHPTAIFSFRYDQTITVLTLALRLGIRIPEDLSLLARSDHPLLNQTIPQVTRYEINDDKLIRNILRMLHKMLEGQSLPTEPHQLIPELKEGETLSTSTTQ